MYLQNLKRKDGHDLVWNIKNIIFNDSTHMSKYTVLGFP